MSGRGISSIARVNACYIDKVVGLELSCPDANAIEGRNRSLQDVAVLDRVLRVGYVVEDVAGNNLDAGSTYLSSLDVGSESTSNVVVGRLEVLVLNTK